MVHVSPQPEASFALLCSLLTRVCMVPCIVLLAAREHPPEQLLPDQDCRLWTQH